MGGGDPHYFLTGMILQAVVEAFKKSKFLTVKCDLQNLKNLKKGSSLPNHNQVQFTGSILEPFEFQGYKLVDLIWNIHTNSRDKILILLKKTNLSHKFVRILCFYVGLWVTNPHKTLKNPL